MALPTIKTAGRTFRSCLLNRPALLAAFLVAIWPAAAQEKITYQDHVLPLIENNCGKCHNPDKKKGDLDLTSYNAALKGGGSGQVVLAGNPDSSKLFKAITHAEDPTMPPNKPRLPDKEIEIFKKWIAGGLLETSGSKAIASSKSAVDLTVKLTPNGKPEGPPPMPQNLPALPVVHTEHLNPVIGMDGSPWAPLVAIAGQKQVLLYNSDSLDLLGVLPFTNGFPADVRFSRNGKLLVVSGGVGGKSGRVVVWDIVASKEMISIGNEYDTVLSADISPDQTKIALGGPSRLVKIYSTQSGELIYKMKKHTDWVTALEFSPNGEMLATADRNGGVVIWDPENGQEIYTLPGHKAGVTSISWRGDSKLLASSGEDGAVKLWEMEFGKIAKTWNAHVGGALWASYTHDGRIVSCGRDNQVIVWDGSGSKQKAMQYSGELPLRAIFSHSGDRVFAGDFTGHVYAWNTKDGKKLGELNSNPAKASDPERKQVAQQSKL